MKDVHLGGKSWNTDDLPEKMRWRYQHPPRGRTGDSTPKLLPLMILILTGPSGPCGYEVGILLSVN